MGSSKIPSKVKLIIGILGENQEILKSLREILCSRLGAEEEVMAPIPFGWTRFYSDELGDNPWRTFVSYEELIPREKLVDVKLATNALEQEFSREGRRRVNQDPGYLTLGQLFHASTKDQRQRVYVRDGIYVEPTLYFQDGAFHAFPWTYRDYQSPEYLAWFLKARSKLAYQRRHGEMPYSSRKKNPPGGGPGDDIEDESALEKD
jgi:hypothetical protein